MSTAVWREWRDVLTILFAGAALCFLLDAAAFRTRIYTRLLDPHASTGSFESTFAIERGREYWARPVLVLGNSIMLHGFSARLANWLQEARGYQFSSVAVPANFERCWYYMLRDLDPDRTRYDVIVIPVESYDDRDLHEDDLADQIIDTRFLAVRLGLSDITEYAASFRTFAPRMEAIKLALLKGLVYRQDFQAFLAHPRDRIADVHYSRSYAEWDNYMYDGLDFSLAGTTVDRNRGIVVSFPSRLKADERQVVRNLFLEPVPPQRGYLGEYRRLWLGRIVARYQGTATRILFVRPPMDAVPRRFAPPATGRSAIREFASRPGVLLLDEHAFEELERPELFYDFQHLNSTGRAQFTTKFVRLFAQVINRESTSVETAERH